MADIRLRDLAAGKVSRVAMEAALTSHLAEVMQDAETADVDFARCLHYATAAYTRDFGRRAASFARIERELAENGGEL